jgi:hypothetical protein
MKGITNNKKMNEINAVRFIIDRLILENKLDDYYKWFLTVRDFHPYRRRDLDKEYQDFTNRANLLYVRRFIPNITFDQLDDLHHGYFYFVVNRCPQGNVIINDNFYNNFIKEVLTYNDNDSGPTLK